MIHQLGFSGMYEELRVGLDGVVTPEYLDVLLAAHRGLTDAGVDSIDDALIGIFGMQDGMADSAMLVNRTADALALGLTEALREYQIAFNPHTPLPVLTGVLQTVSTFEHYTIPETLWALTTTGEDPDWILGQITGLFSDTRADDVMEHVDQVDGSVITRMRQVAEDRMQHEAPEPDVPADYHERIGVINHIQRLTARKHPKLAMDLAEAGFPINQPLLTIVEQCLDKLDQMPPGEAGREFLGLVYYSNTPLHEARDEAVGLAADFTDSPSEQFRIERAIDELVNDLKVGGV